MVVHHETENGDGRILRRLQVCCMISTRAHTYLQYKLYIVTLAGNVVGTFSPEPDPGFGIRTVSWHPSGLFLAVAGTDDKVC